MRSWTPVALALCGVLNAVAAQPVLPPSIETPGDGTVLITAKEVSFASRRCRCRCHLKSNTAASHLLDPLQVRFALAGDAEVLVSTLQSRIDDLEVLFGKYKYQLELLMLPKYRKGTIQSKR